jgi:hypothetical protein
MAHVVVYHGTVPNNKNQEKVDLLRYFAKGVTRAGDVVHNEHRYTVHESPVAVIQGWVTQGPKLRPHLELRNKVVQTQLQKNKYVVAVDSNLFLYADPGNSMHYLRYSFNSVFPDAGIYCDTTPDPARWASISKNLGIKLQPYRTTGDHILLCLQRNGGWSMGGFDVQDWAVGTINAIRQHTNRTIVIRAHPGDKNAMTYLNPTSPLCKIRYGKNIRLSTATDIKQDLKNCWAAVNHNSSPVVAAAISGVPIFVTDPQHSQCRDIANTNLALIENPLMPDRQQWVERLAMSHWNFEEVRSGQAWSHMRQFIVTA